MNWEAAVKQIGPALLRYFMASFPRHLSDELVQETFIRLVRKVESREFDSSKGSLLKFSYGIARFMKLETLKSLPHERASEDVVFAAADTVSKSSDEEYETKEQVVRLRKAISKLPEIQQEIIALTLDDEMSLPEISEILEMPLGTIKSHIHRAKISLLGIMRIQEEINEGLGQRP